MISILVFCHMMTTRLKNWSLIILLWQCLKVQGNNNSFDEDVGNVLSFENLFDEDVEESKEPYEVIISFKILVSV